VTFHDFTPSGWGWTANIPGFGLLADQFTDPALHIWTYDRVGMTPAAFSPMGRVPLKPFTGTIGLAPAEPGLHSVVRRGRSAATWTSAISPPAPWHLPVSRGRLFSVGDAAQGDGGSGGDRAR
jgi:acetamidase/formamidase